LHVEAIGDEALSVLCVLLQQWQDKDFCCCLAWCYDLYGYGES